ncbi:MAG: phosphoglycerate kinase [Candidatus Heimdallarchaeota archaeon]|nr:phosphoglycerate kinase [Candidatus Heimdallarchaeota archaeon]MCK4954734.1 phosphoglycerate kinase [Candidatus Heimdallarchaeota archaeon]
MLQFKEKKSITDLDLRNKKVLVRVDFNVPLDEYGNITDSRRIRMTLPTIHYLLNENCKIILLSHLGRPDGKIKDAFRTDPIYKRLKEYLPFVNVDKADDCVGPEVERMVSKMKRGEILVLENPRFHPNEKKCDPEFSKQLSDLADVYVTDAFATAHRRHASTYGVCPFFKEKGYGFLMEKELKFLSNCLNKPKRPFTIILGGKKVNDKLDVIKYLLGLADAVLIGGGMAYTFLLAMGYNIGKSIRDLSKLDNIRDYLETARSYNTKIFLPRDVVVCDELDYPSEIKNVPITEIRDNHVGVDIGEETIEYYKKVLSKSSQVVWQGPLGVFERKEFENGTKEIARHLIENEIYTVIGGGDSAAAFEKFGFQDDVSFISTGGGASLEIMKGTLLPAIACLTDK